MIKPHSPKLVRYGMPALFALLAGCVDYQIVGWDDGGARFLENNFVTFDHPNSEKAIAEVRAKAEKMCRQSKQVAIKTESVCSLTKCTTNYQCVKQADAIKYGL